MVDIGWEGPKEDPLMEDTRSFSVFPEGAHPETDKVRDGKKQASSTIGSIFQLFQDSHADLNRQQSCP